jgi:hypothetical protein
MTPLLAHMSLHKVSVKRGRTQVAGERAGLNGYGVSLNYFLAGFSPPYMREYTG